MSENTITKRQVPTAVSIAFVKKHKRRKYSKDAGAGERPVLNNAKTIIEITIIIKYYEKSSKKVELP